MANPVRRVWPTVRLVRMPRPSIRVRDREVKFSAIITHFPSHKADCLDDSGLHDFFTRENTPCDSIWAIRMSVRAKVASLVYNIIGDVGISLNVSEEKGKQGRIHEELEVSLLVDIAVRWTPTKGFVIAPSTVHGWLRING